MCPLTVLPNAYRLIYMKHHLRSTSKPCACTDKCAVLDTSKKQIIHTPESVTLTKAVSTMDPDC